MRAQTLACQSAHSRDEESPADLLFADVVRHRTGADIVLLPGGCYGTALIAGTVRAMDLRNLMPHDSKVVVVTLPGNEILEILEQSLENVYTEYFRKKVGGIVQVSGLRARFGRKTLRGKRITQACIGSKPLSHETHYTVATNSFLAFGGHSYRTFLAGKKRREWGEQYEIVRDALRQIAFRLRMGDG